MPSGGSAAPRDPAATTLFIDRNSGGRTFRALLAKAGVHVVLHDEQFPNKTADEDWLQVIGTLGWLIVTGDIAVRRAPLFVHRLAHSRAHVFVLLELNGLSAEEKPAASSIVCRGCANWRQVPSRRRCGRLAKLDPFNGWITRKFSRG